MNIIKKLLSSKYLKIFSLKTLGSIISLSISIGVLRLVSPNVYGEYLIIISAINLGLVFNFSNITFPLAFENNQYVNKKVIRFSVYGFLSSLILFTIISSNSFSYFSNTTIIVAFVLLIIKNTRLLSEGLFLKYFEPQTFIKVNLILLTSSKSLYFLLLFNFLNPINIFLASEVLYEALFGIYVFYKSKSKIKFSDSDVNQNIERQGLLLWLGDGFEKISSNLMPHIVAGSLGLPSLGFWNRVTQLGGSTYQIASDSYLFAEMGEIKKSPLAISIRLINLLTLFLLINPNALLTFLGGSDWDIVNNIFYFLITSLYMFYLSSILVDNYCVANDKLKEKMASNFVFLLISLFLLFVSDISNLETLSQIFIYSNFAKIITCFILCKNNDKNFSYNLEKNDFISFSAFLLLVLFVYFIFQHSLIGQTLHFIFVILIFLLLIKDFVESFKQIF